MSLEFNRRVRPRRGFALIEVLVVTTVVAIVIACAVFLISSITTKPVDHACSIQARAFERAVGDYRRRNNAVPQNPGASKTKTTSNVYGVGLTLQMDGDVAGPVRLSHYGPGADQWNYDVKSGVVTLGDACD